MRRARARAASDLGGILPRPRSAGTLEQTIAKLQDRLRIGPDRLARRWRRSASPTCSRHASRPTPATTRRLRACCERSLGLERNENFASHRRHGRARRGAARLRRRAARGASRPEAIDPYNGNVYGVIGDAQVELGSYGRRSPRSRRWSTRCRALASYARVSYARELMGDVPGAIEGDEAGARDRWHAGGRRVGQLPARRAVFQPRATSDDAASCLRRGRRDRCGLRARPFAGLAKVAWARGRSARRPSPATPMSSRGTPRPST